MTNLAHRPLINSHASTVVPRVVATLGVWRRRARERAELARFSEHELHDIGLSRSWLYTEVNKPFWRA